MAYSLEADQRTQSPFKDTVNIPAAYISQKIAEADDIINSVIGGTYVLPLSVVPQTIVDISKALTTLLLYREQSMNLEVFPGIDVTKQWELQMMLLDAIGKRTKKLLDANGVELQLQPSALPSGYPNASSSSPSALNSTAPKFTMNQIF